MRQLLYTITTIFVISQFFRNPPHSLRRSPGSVIDSVYSPRTYVRLVGLWFIFRDTATRRPIYSQHAVLTSFTKAIIALPHGGSARKAKIDKRLNHFLVRFQFCFKIAPAVTKTSCK